MADVILSANLGAVTTDSGRQYAAHSGGGLFRGVTARDARDMVKLGGAVCSLSGTTRRATGWRCRGCGFGSFVRRCSRCGGECHRE